MSPLDLPLTLIGITLPPMHPGLTKLANQGWDLLDGLTMDYNVKETEAGTVRVGLQTAHELEIKKLAFCRTATILFKA